MGGATAGSTFFTFIGYVLGPTVFALAIEAVGGYAVCFAALAAVPPLAALALVRRQPRARS
jgi:hypothetical protein